MSITIGLLLLLPHLHSPHHSSLGSWNTQNSLLAPTLSRSTITSGTFSIKVTTYCTPVQPLDTVHQLLQCCSSGDVASKTMSSAHQKLLINFPPFPIPPANPCMALCICCSARMLTVTSLPHRTTTTWYWLSWQRHVIVCTYSAPVGPTVQVWCEIENSDSRFESIHRFILSESIRFV